MKILISDFDKTLYTHDFKKNINKINEFTKSGNIFVIATGRSLIQLREIIDSYNISFSYLICNDGGVIYDSQFKMLKRIDIKESLVAKVFLEVKEDSCVTEAYIDTANGYSTIVSDNDKITNAIIGRYKNTLEASKLLKKIESIYPLVHGYLSDNWINITDINVTKGNGIKFLKELNNWDIKDIYTIGDTINDESMMIYNGHAMENGSKNLKKLGTPINSVWKLIDKINKKEENI